MSLLPQFGFIELLLVAAVALIVVGPKDLPILLRKCGQMLGQAKRMAGEFTSAFDQMAREAEMDELRAEMEALKSANPLAQVKEEVDEAFKPLGDAVQDTVKDGETLYRDDPDADDIDDEEDARAVADALNGTHDEEGTLDEISLSPPDGAELAPHGATKTSTPGSKPPSDATPAPAKPADAAAE